MTRRDRWNEADILQAQERMGQTRPSDPPVINANVFIVIPGEPQAKPRQTQSDKWQTRPVVAQYRRWADHARRCLFKATGSNRVLCGHVDLVAYFTIPKSCKNPSELMGLPHQEKPDGDNLIKALQDALVIKDQRVHEVRFKKRWDDGNGARVEVSLYG